MKKVRFSKCILAGISTLCVLVAMFLAVISINVNASRIVKVAFFPMDGYHMRTADGGYGGMDVEYLRELNKYTGWDVEYVDCYSWGEALRLVKEGKADLIGSAQYSEERAKEFLYPQMPSGYTFGVVAVNEDSTVAAKEFSAMKEFKFGVVKSYVRKNEFISYLKENGLDAPQIVEFENTTQMHEAFNKGEINAVTCSVMDMESGQRIVGRYSPSMVYYISSKANTELIKELDLAISKLNMNSPGFVNQLMKKYYGERTAEEILLSQEEKEYIEDHGEFVVGYVDGFYPFSFVSSDRYCGLSRQVLDAASEATGMEFKYEKMPDKQNAMDALEAEDIDILAYFPEKSDENLQFAATYVSAPLSVAVKTGRGATQIQKIAIVAGLENSVDLITDSKDARVTVYNDVEECIRAMERRSADAAICNTYLASYILNSGSEYEDIELQSVHRDEQRVGIAINKNADERLGSILEKSITTLDNQQITKYMLENPIEIPFNLKGWIKSNMLVINLAIIVLAFIAILIIIRMLYISRKIQKLMYKDTELDTWNLNYFIYWARTRLESVNNKNNYVIVSLHMPKFRLFEMIYGKEAGVKLLRATADILDECINSREEIYAISQGEKLVMMLLDDGAVVKRLNFIKKQCEKHINSEFGVHITVNIGACYCEGENYDIQKAITKSNQAVEHLREMDVAKGAVQVFDEELNKRFKRKHDREELLERADIKKDFTVFYQPKVDIRTNKLVGAEALVRMFNPYNPKKIIAPGYFVPYYENTGMIKEIDFFVLESVCKMLYSRIKSQRPVVPVSCNFSRRHFADEEFEAKFNAILKKYGIPKELIELEITETMIVEELYQKQIHEVLEKLHNQGIKICIDDFGSGYSSLGIFESIPASVLKLDRSFFRNHIDRERQVKILRKIVSLANSLEAQVVCEGIENQEDLDLMKEIGAYIAQGFYYSNPQPKTAFEKELDKLEEIVKEINGIREVSH